MTPRSAHPTIERARCPFALRTVNGGCHESPTRKYPLQTHASSRALEKEYPPAVRRCREGRLTCCLLRVLRDDVAPERDGAVVGLQHAHSPFSGEEIPQEKRGGTPHAAPAVTPHDKELGDVQYVRIRSRRRTSRRQGEPGGTVVASNHECEATLRIRPVERETVVAIAAVVS